MFHISKTTVRRDFWIRAIIRIITILNEVTRHLIATKAFTVRETRIPTVDF